MDRALPPRIEEIGNSFLQLPTAGKEAERWCRPPPGDGPFRQPQQELRVPPRLDLL
jgi:hypothetical protein